MLKIKGSKETSKTIYEMKNHKIALGFFLLLALVHSRSFAQDQKGDRVILAFSEGLKSAKFYIYSPPFLAKAIYKDTVEAKNIYPEGLMSSILSESNTGWTKYNEPVNTTAKGKTHYDWVKKMNREKNFFKLQHKFQWEEKGQECVFITFYFVREGIPKATSGVTFMKKIGGRWIVSSVPTGMDNLAIVLMRFQSDKMMQLLEGNTTNNVLMDAVIARTRAEGNTLDFEKLLAAYASWYESKDQKMIDYFIDKNAW